MRGRNRSAIINLQKRGCVTLNSINTTHNKCIWNDMIWYIVTKPLVPRSFYYITQSHYDEYAAQVGQNNFNPISRRHCSWAPAVSYVSIIHFYQENLKQQHGITNQQDVRYVRRTAIAKLVITQGQTWRQLLSLVMDYWFEKMKTIQSDKISQRQ